MSPAIVAPLLPTRTQIEGWGISHLEEAEARWRAWANESLEAFEQHLHSVLIPGGTAWHGKAQEAAEARAMTDLNVVRYQSETLMEAADIARRGSEEIQAARSQTLEAIAEAEANGFLVLDDLSLVDNWPADELTAAARVAEADAHSEFIQWRAEQLVAADNLVGRLLNTKSVELSSIRFDGERNIGSGGPQALPDHESKRAHVDADSKPSLDDILARYQVAEDRDGMVQWKPVWPASFFTGPIEVTATEARMIDDLGLLGQRDMGQIKHAARAAANQRFPPPLGKEIDNHNDAFRHAYWNALMTQRFGEKWTRDYATAHEGRTANYASSEAMDLWNNEVGRSIAVANPKASPNELADLVQKAVRDGDTVVVRPDGKGLAWSNQNPLDKAGDSSVSSPVPGHSSGRAETAQSKGGYEAGQQGDTAIATGGYS